MPVTLQGLLVGKCCSYPRLRVRPPGEDEHEDAEDDEWHGKQQVRGVGPEHAAGTRRIYSVHRKRGGVGVPGTPGCSALSTDTRSWVRTGLGR